jgi:acyl-lipid omega-6 desaturase (Delta-12 desaturase)
VTLSYYLFIACPVTSPTPPPPALSAAEPGTDLLLDPHKLARALSAFKDPRPVRSGWELAITLVPFVVLVGLMLFAVQAGLLYALVLAPLAGLFLLRLFIIQHDCGHGSFFANRTTNDWLGRALGLLTFTPYDCWRHSHARHHATTGNLDTRGSGDIDTLTVREFFERSWLQRFFYRFYRNPVVLLGLGPAYQFLLRHRLPVGLFKDSLRYWISAMGTNAGIGLILLGLIYQFGLATALLVFLPVLLIAATMGVWLFYIQHQFEAAHWDQGQAWSFHDAALQGSSHLELPAVLRWFTGNIGIHHVHHLVSRIPFYRLPEALKAMPSLQGLNRVTALDAIAALRLALWDEDQRRLVTFREAKRATA